MAKRVTKSTSSKPISTRNKAVDIELIEDTIRRRAYELYQERGASHGRDVEDWLRAEREVSPVQQRKRARS